MPCNSDHMEPTVKERQHKLSAELLVFVYEKLGKPVSAFLRQDAKNTYGGGPHMASLCTAIRDMSEDELNRIVYNGRDPMSRRLADWWEEHQREDLKAREAEAAKHKTFDACLELAKELEGQRNSDMSSTARRIAQLSGQYWDEDANTHVFTFEDGVIILSAMDGLTAYKGKRA
ncbi:hypothetical protein RPALISO_182 [Ruegeria phage RpAliso]|nr:hypothetical protein RPALISO_182 [Ruegeria phage RpAliso]